MEVTFEKVSFICSLAVLAFQLHLESFNSVVLNFQFRVCLLSDRSYSVSQCCRKMLWGWEEMNEYFSAVNISFEVRAISDI